MCARAGLRGVSPAVEAQFGYIEVPVVHLDDLYAGKLCAALDRQHPRDLFDVQLLLKHEGINDGLLEVFVVYLLSSDRPLAEMMAPRRQPLATIFEEQFTWYGTGAGYGERAGTDEGNHGFPHSGPS